MVYWDKIELQMNQVIILWIQKEYEVGFLINVESTDQAICNSSRLFPED